MGADTRNRILDALRTVLAAGGIAAATLESVASHAGVSKGGLLYHFPSKDALYAGLVAQTRERVAAECAALRAGGNLVRGYLEYTAPRDEQERGFVTALIEAHRGLPRPDEPTTAGGPDARADDPDPAATVFAEIFEPWAVAIREEINDPVLAEIVLQTGNGWYLSGICGLRPTEPALMAAVVDDLIARVDAVAAGG